MDNNATAHADTSPVDANASAGLPAPTDMDDAPTVDAKPYAVFPTAEHFQNRVSQAAKSQLKESLGITPEEAKARLERLSELEKAEEERRKSEMSEIERWQAEAREAMKAAEEAREEAARLQVVSRIAHVCAERGIKDVDYAQHRIEKKLLEMSDEDVLDEASFLDDLLKDKRARIALGVEDVPTAESQKVQKPVTSTPVVGASHQQPTPKAADPGQSKSAYDLTPDQWQARKRALGI